MADAKKTPRAARRTLRGVEVSAKIADEAKSRKEKGEMILSAVVALPSLAEALREYVTTLKLGAITNEQIDALLAENHGKYGALIDLSN